MIRRLSLMVVLVVASTAGVAHAAGPSSVGRTRGTVLLAGDSNIVLGTTQITLALQDRDHGYLVASIARSGATLRGSDCPTATCATHDFWKARIAAARTTVTPSAWVTDLGVNDTASAGTATTPGYAAYGAKIDWWLAQTGTTPVLWTNLPCRIEPAGRAVGCAAVNRALAAAPARHPNLRVLDWAKVANGHPEWIGGLAGVHYSTDGYAAWAKLVASQLDARFAAP